MEKIKVNVNYTDKVVLKEYNNYNDLINDLYLNLAYVVDKNIISNISSHLDLFPMYDIYTENIHLVKTEELFNRLNNFHYRPINNEIYQLIFKTNKPKLINFLKNYDINILYKTFYKIIYNNNPSTEELTDCVRPSFLPILKSAYPYYTKTELIYLALNKNLWHDKLILSSICDIIKSNDIDGNILLNHQIYIRENLADSYIKYYSFLGSSIFNYYLRFPSNMLRDTVLEGHINNFRDILIKSPPWNKPYIFYRWINQDNFLKGYNIGDIWIDNGFLSTTREPFVNPNKNYFGYILVKIKVPANIIGCGLAIEYYSHFPDEQEIVFPPSKYKLVNTSDTKYFHPNEIVTNKVVSKYEFEWIGHLDNYLDKTKFKSGYNFISTLDNQLDGYSVSEKLDNFMKKYKNKFITKIGSSDIIFNVAKIESDQYDHFFYLNLLDYIERGDEYEKEIFITWQNEKTGEINLFIEIGAVISVNYYSRFNPSETKIIGDYKYDDILDFINRLALLFNIERIIIHSDYKKYWDIIDTNKVKEDLYSYHNKQLYISDCFYFNQLLYHYICNASMIHVQTSNFIEYLYNNKNVKFTYGIDALTHLMDINLVEFVNIFKNDMMVMNESYIELIFKLANKLIIKNIDTTNLLVNITKAKRKVIPGKKIIDLYLYISLNYYYLIPYLHALIFNTLNIDLDNLVFTMSKKSEYGNIIMPLSDITKISNLKNIFLKRTNIIQAKYKLLNS